MNIKLEHIIEVERGFTIAEATDGKRYKLSGGTLAWRNNNPGNLKFGDFARNFGALGPGWENHAIFPDIETGNIARQQLLFSDEGFYYNLSIKDAISKYAPIDDPNPIAKNNPTEYAKFVANHTGVGVNTVLHTLNETQQNLLLNAMGKFEGFKEGSVTLLPSPKKD
jgi:hypothetical protein